MRDTAALEAWISGK